MKTKIFNESTSVGRGWGNIEYHNQPNWYYEGTVATAIGYVIVYSEKGHASFRFIYRGRLYMRTYRRSFSERGLVSKAKAFSNDVIEEVESAFGGV